MLLASFEVENCKIHGPSFDLHFLEVITQQVCWHTFLFIGCLICIGDPMYLGEKSILHSYTCILPHKHLKE
ncbi:hypothetical protein BDA96_08G116200 [Sorghum bicolor]|uniref:Uncharacterized protein n=1 Tax=Sorghum bicolor TaxID=4558 RepID=A0A921QER6_SORBI|nr:hypothetical protein BDA96_08G116200 [Sorghum bicolor]